MYFVDFVGLAEILWAERPVLVLYNSVFYSFCVLSYSQNQNRKVLQCPMTIMRFSLQLCVAKLL